MSITIIFVNYHSAVDLLECLASLEASFVPEGFTRKIVVVDNDQPSKLKEIPGVEILRQGKNLGFTGANNLAIKKFPSDFYLLLNPDTIVYKTFLIELLKPFINDRHPGARRAIGSSSGKIDSIASLQNDAEKIGLASPKIYFYPGNEFHKKRYEKRDLGKVIWYAGGEIDWKNIVGKHKRVDKVDKPDVTISTEAADTDFATGCCLLISQEVVEKIGFLWEDVDYSLRAKKAGFRVVYVPRAVIWYKNTSMGYSKFPSCVFPLSLGRIRNIKSKGVTMLEEIKKLIEQIRKALGL